MTATISPALEGGDSSLDISIGVVVSSSFLLKLIAFRRSVGISTVVFDSVSGLVRAPSGVVRKVEPESE
jgi:hypothetical protein